MTTNIINQNISLIFVYSFMITPRYTGNITIDMPNKYEKTHLDTLLFFCYEYDHARRLLGDGAYVNAKNNIGRTPLHYCEFPRIAELFIKAGADVNATDDNGNTPLHTCKNVSIAKILVENGANINAINEDNKTPLTTARNKEIREYLINKGAMCVLKNES